MARKNLVAVDSENEAKFRAYFEIIPAYLLTLPDIEWIEWLFSDRHENAVFQYLYGRFGVDEHGQRLTNEPDAAKGIHHRRWRAVPYKEIADAMGLNIRTVKKAVRNLEENGFVDVMLIPEGSKTVPHFCMNWGRLLSALIEAVDSQDSIKKHLATFAEEEMPKARETRRKRKPKKP